MFCFEVARWKPRSRTWGSSDLSGYLFAKRTSKSTLSGVFPRRDSRRQSHRADCQQVCVAKVFQRVARKRRNAALGWSFRHSNTNSTASGRIAAHPVQRTARCVWRTQSVEKIVRGARRGRNPLRAALQLKPDRIGGLLRHMKFAITRLNRHSMHLARQSECDFADRILAAAARQNESSLTAGDRRSLDLNIGLPPIIALV